MKRSMIRRSVFVLVVCTLLAGSFLAGRLLARPKAVQARTEPDPISPASIDANYSCYLDNVAAFDDRIHVRCDDDYFETGIRYFAFPIGGANGYTASRMLAVGQTAFALGKPVWIFFDSNSDSNPSSCYTTNCRLLTGISMVN